MAKNSNMLRIGELSRRVGKTSRTLHFYEELGLLAPAARTRGGFRLYSEDALLRVKWISRLQDLGFSLQEISSFLRDLHGHESGPEAMARLSRCYDEKLSETRAAIKRLKALEQDLVASLEYLEGCRSCDPVTPRSDCMTCDEENHDNRAAPQMVAAVHETL